MWPIDVIKILVTKIFHLLLGILRVLRKAICCRKKKEADYVLPITVDHVIDMENMTCNNTDVNEWEEWPVSNIPSNRSVIQNTDTVQDQTATDDCQEKENLDYFKDMVPQIRKPKKVFVPNETRMVEKDAYYSNRLAMDPKAAITMEPDLGSIDDNACTWESDEAWATAFLEESKKIEQEKKRADQQRKKQDREKRRAPKLDSLSKILNIQDPRHKMS